MPSPDEKEKPATVELTLANVIEAFRIAMPHLATPHGAQDQCLYAASFFRGLLAAADVDAEVVGGEYVDSDEIVVWGHYATRVEDVVYDWSARQFYPPADWPTVVSWEQWSANLKIDTPLFSTVRSSSGRDQ